jgi:hypothetical protein
MLGVRRAGVTVALHYLKDRGLIELAHGQIVMTDRAGLRAAANGTERRFSNVSWTFCIVAHWFAL